MKTSRSIRWLIPLLVMGVLTLGSGVAPRAEDEPDPCQRPEKNQEFAGSGFGRQLGRGLTNIGLCWLEVPYQIKTHLQNKEDEYELGVFLPTFNMVCGVAAGAVHTVTRCATGVYETVMSPFPPYDPVDCPNWPPYVHREKPAKKVVIVVKEAPTPAVPPVK